MRKGVIYCDICFERIPLAAGLWTDWFKAGRKGGGGAVVEAEGPVRRLLEYPKRQEMD